MDPTGFLHFNGTDSETIMMGHLLCLMDVCCDCPEDYFYSLPMDFHGVCPLALLGTLYDEYNTSLNLESAPRLFAALFPNASFHYSITLWDDYPSTLTAVYEDHGLRLRESYYDYGRARSFCWKLIEQDSENRNKYEEYLREWGTEDDPDYPELVNWFGLYAELNGCDSCKELVDSTYPYYDVQPSRDINYEKSFFKKGDLHTYLICEQIKRCDLLLTEYLRDFSFTKKQINEFIAVAQECNDIELSSFLLEEMERSYKAD